MTQQANQSFFKRELELGMKLAIAGFIVFVSSVSAQKHGDKNNGHEHEEWRRSMLYLRFIVER